MKEEKILQKELFTKLAKVQKLAIKLILNDKEISFVICSYTMCANMYGINNIEPGHNYYQVRLKPYDFFDYDKKCKFYKEQIEIVDYWLKILE